MRIFKIEKVETAHQIEMVAQLVQEIWPEIYVSIIGEAQVNYMLETYQSLENIQQDIAKGDQYFILQEDNVPVGYTAYNESSEEVYLSKLYLNASTRGKGYGGQVFAWYDELAAGKKLRLNVNKDNKNAIKIYEHQGFKCVESCQNDIGNGFVMDDYVYLKDLT